MMKRQAPLFARTWKALAVSGLALSVMLVAGAGAAQAGTLEDMERERAVALGILLDPVLDPLKREADLETSRRRLIDLERLVLRDDSLKGRNTPTVRRAFENYDLTFMVHASTEKQLPLLDHWMSNLGLTTEDILAGRVGRR